MLALILALIFLALFATAFVAVGAGWILLERRRPAVGPAGPRSATAPRLLQGQQLSSISVWQRLLARFDFAEILQRRLAESGLKWSAGRLTLSMLLSASVAAAIPCLMDWAPIVTAPMCGLAAALAPYFAVLHKRRVRFQKIEEQLPDVLDSLSRALRAGHPFGAGMVLVGQEAPEPLAQEIRRACDEWRLGLVWQSALDNFARRVPLLEVRLFVAAVALQSRFGGKLNEVLEELARTIRDSIALRGDVKAISAQGRLTGTVLTILPVALAVVMLVTNPAYIGILLTHPAGTYLIAAAVASLALGHFTIRQIVNVKV